MASIPRLRQSFCGCTLETSSLIIAWLGVLGIAFQLLLGVCLFGVFYNNLEEELQKKHATELEIQQTMLQVKVAAVMLFVFYTVALAIDTMLLVGIYKRNYCLMTPWIIISGFGCVMGILSFVLTVISALLNPVVFLAAILQGMAVAFGIYCFLLVYSHYSEVKEEKQMNDNRFKSLGA